MEKYFVTYRYGVPIGRIFKSFITLIRQPQEGNISPPLLFTQKLRDRYGNPRFTRGFGVSIGDRLYLVGSLDEGAALDIMAISNVSPARTTMTGLEMSISVASELLSARLVGKKITAKLDYKDIGLKTYHEVYEEIKDLKDFRDMIANRIDFD